MLSQSVTIRMNAIAQFVPVVLIVMLNRVVLNFTVFGRNPKV